MSDTPQDAARTLLALIEQKIADSKTDEFAEKLKNHKVFKIDEIALLPVLGTLKGIVKGSITHSAPLIKEEILKFRDHYPENQDIQNAVSNVIQHGITVIGSNLIKTPNKRHLLPKSDITPQKAAQTLLDIINNKTEMAQALRDPITNKISNYIFAPYLTKDKKYFDYTVNILKGVANGTLTTGTDDIAQPLYELAKWDVSDKKMHTAIYNVYSQGIVAAGQDLTKNRGLAANTRV